RPPSGPPAHTRGRAARWLPPRARCRSPGAAAGAAGHSLAPGPVPRAGATAAASRAGPRPSAHGPTAGSAGGLAMTQRLHSVHPHLIDAGSQLLRTLVGRVILNGLRIEHHDVREIARLQHAAVR